jgi:hypothetical protein
MLNKVKYWILGMLTVLALSATIAYAATWSLPPAIQRGDLIVATSTTQSVRLPTSTKGSVLWISAAGVPAWTATSTLGINGGGSLSGGTNGFDALWTSASTLTAGKLIDNGTVLGVNASSSSYTVNLQGNAATNPLNVASSSGTSMFTVNANNNIVFQNETLPALSGQKFFTVVGSQSGGIARILRDTGLSPLASQVYGTYDITAYSATSTVDWPNLTGPAQTFSIATGTMQNSIADIAAVRDGNDTTGDLQLRPYTNGGPDTVVALSGNTSNSSMVVTGVSGSTNILNVASSSGASLFQVNSQPSAATVYVQGSPGASAPLTVASSTGTFLFQVNSLPSAATAYIQGSAGAGTILNVASSSSTSLFQVTGAGNVNIATLTAASLIMTDSGKNLQSASLGTNLSFSGNQLQVSASPSFSGTVTVGALTDNSAATIATTLAVTGTSTLATTTVAGINILGTFDKSFSLASSTPDYQGNSFSSATYTLASIWNPYRTATLVSLFCETDTGTVLLNFQTSLLSCTTSGASSTPNTTLNSRANIQVKIGSETSSPNNLSVTATFHY